MPIRDVETFAAARDGGPRILSNRGANGIDGTVAAALGAAAAGDGPVVLHIGDVALAYDLGALLSARRLGLDLTIVLVNNDGGGIFDFLPVAREGDATSSSTSRRRTGSTSRGRRALRRPPRARADVADAARASWRARSAPEARRSSRSHGPRARTSRCTGACGTPSPRRYAAEPLRACDARGRRRVRPTARQQKAVSATIPRRGPRCRRRPARAG